MLQTSESFEKEHLKIIQITKEKKEKIEQFNLNILLLNKIYDKIILTRCKLSNDITDSIYKMATICDLTFIKKQLKSYNVIHNDNIKNNLTNNQIQSVWKLHSWVFFLNYF